MSQWIAQTRIIGEECEGSKRSGYGYRPFYLSRIVVGGGVQKKMMRLKLGSSEGEGARPEAWEMTGTRREDGIAKT